MDHIGIDVHLKYSEICVLCEEGNVLERQRVSTTETSLGRLFRRRNRSRVVMECGSMTPWLHRLLAGWGHDVVVVNPRRVRLIAESTLKSDRIDAEILARLSRFDPQLVGSLYQRSYEGQVLRTQLRVRTELVRARTRLINSVRGTLRAHGYRMSSCVASSFVVRFELLALEDDLRLALEPLLEMIGQLTEQIERLRQEIVEYSESDELLVRLQEVPGVGPIVSVAYFAWMDRAERFRRSRDVAACLGLRPRIRSSGGKTVQGKITREGDAEMRRLLVQAAHASFQCQKDSELRRWAAQLAERVGKKKAVVAVARKIAVILHRLWITGHHYQAFPQQA